MTGIIDQRLEELAIDLPPATPPAANYIPYVVSGTLVYISGQLPMVQGKIACRGRVGDDITVEEAADAARHCAINIVSQIKAACDGDLDRVVRCVKIGGFVNATEKFEDHPQVINGASDLMVDIFGDAGRHSRFAVGAASLPFNAAVEIDAIFEIST